jgi:ABC-type methionine transport system ATPase subunit
MEHGRVVEQIRLSDARTEPRTELGRRLLDERSASARDVSPQKGLAYA